VWKKKNAVIMCDRGRIQERGGTQFKEATAEAMEVLLQEISSWGAGRWRNQKEAQTRGKAGGKNHKTHKR